MKSLSTPDLGVNPSASRKFSPRKTMLVLASVVLTWVISSSLPHITKAAQDRYENTADWVETWQAPDFWNAGHITLVSVLGAVYLVLLRVFKSLKTSAQQQGLVVSKPRSLCYAAVCSPVNAFRKGEPQTGPSDPSFSWTRVIVFLTLFVGVLAAAHVAPHAPSFAEEKYDELTATIQSWHPENYVTLTNMAIMVVFGGLIMTLLRSILLLLETLKTVGTVVVLPASLLLTVGRLAFGLFCTAPVTGSNASSKSGSEWNWKALSLVAVVIVAAYATSFVYAPAWTTLSDVVEEANAMILQWHLADYISATNTVLSIVLIGLAVAAVRVLVAVKRGMDADGFSVVLPVSWLMTFLVWIAGPFTEADSASDEPSPNQALLGKSNG